MDISLQLSQKLQQKLSPQQIQMIKLIEVPTLQLEQRVQQELQDNPALEEGVDNEAENDDNEHEVDENGDPLTDTPINDNTDFEEYMDEGIPDYRLTTHNQSRDEMGVREEIPFSIGVSFQEHLQEQLGLRQLNDQDRAVAQFIIGNIDDDGYLRRDLESLADDIAFQTSVSVSLDDLERLLAIVQSFEPTGVGARSLQECLLLQLRKKEPSDDVNNAILILTKDFDAFAKKHFDKLSRLPGMDETKLKNAIAIITRLTPKPGAAFSTTLEKNMQQIVPDFIVTIEQGEPVVALNNDSIPPLRVSPDYREMLKTYTQDKAPTRQIKDAASFVKQKLDAAKWFIDALKQRNDTMMRVMLAIAHLQRDFLISGDEMNLKPMILKDIADVTNLDISTVSRVSNSKYVQTHFGVLPVKHFFSESMLTQDGEEVSSRTIKSILLDCVENEDKRKPIPDEQLMEELKRRGFIIARRTVAKYREQLGIPVARLRKQV